MIRGLLFITDNDIYLAPYLLTTDINDNISGRTAGKAELGPTTYLGKRSPE